MSSSSRPCQYEGCTKKGAYVFNNLCNYHWQKRIDENIKKVGDAERKKIAAQHFADKKREPF